MGNKRPNMGCVSSKAERDLFAYKAIHGTRSEQKPSKAVPWGSGTDIATERLDVRVRKPPSTSTEHPNPNTASHSQIQPPTYSGLLERSWHKHTGLSITSATDSKPKRTLPTMGCNTNVFQRTHSCLLSVPVSEPATLSRAMSADSLDTRDPQCLRHELPEKTVSFNIFNPSEAPTKTKGTAVNSDAYFRSIAIDRASANRALEFLGLVLDDLATVQRVLTASPAKRAGVQPGWRLRWIKVLMEPAVDSQFQGRTKSSKQPSLSSRARWTTSSISSRRDVIGVLAECKLNRQFRIKVVFASITFSPERGVLTRHLKDISKLCHDVGITFSPEPSDQGVAPVILMRSEPL